MKWCLVAGVCLLATPLMAQDIGDSSAGEVIAMENCAQCHAIGKTGASPFDEAPPFRQIMTRYEAVMLEEALAEGIVTGHPGMPEFEFTPEQVSDLTAFLAQLENLAE